MWPFKPHAPQLDDENVIYLADGNFLPLRSETPELEEKYYNLIKEKMSEWMLRDLTFGQTNQIPLSNILSYQLAHLDLKQLPFTGNSTSLATALEDTTASSAGSRFLDLVAQIALAVPAWYLELLQGRLLYATSYYLPISVTINGEELQLPTKQQWIELLDIYPFAPLLFILQEVYDTDAGVRKLEEILEALPQNNVASN